MNRQQRRALERQSRKASSQETAATPPAISEAKLESNRANAQLSTGPRTEAGRAISCQNNFQHGFRGKFRTIEGEDPAEFQSLLDALTSEHNPQTATETILVQTMAEHYWLMQRARRCQDEQPDKMSLWLRYESQHERGFHKCLSMLLKFRKERIAEQRGFERQNADAAAQEAKTRLANARSESLELDSAVKAIIQAPIPGLETFDLNDVKRAFTIGAMSVARTKAAA